MTRFARRLSLATFISACAVLAPALAESAFATSHGSQPASLVLRESDFPAHTQYTLGDIPSNAIQALKKIGVDARGAYFGASIPFGSGKSETVSGAVYTTADPSQANKAYAAFRSEYTHTGAKLPLPLYGDTQIVQYKPETDIAEVLVRRNSVVWQLSVQSLSLLHLSKEKLTTEIDKYAAKQKSRVGAG
jgi:hypothetical protein